MIYVQTDRVLWRLVEDTLWQLDRKEITLALPDVIVGCCALKVGAAVLTVMPTSGSSPEFAPSNNPTDFGKLSADC